MEGASTAISARKLKRFFTLLLVSLAIIAGLYVNENQVTPRQAEPPAPTNLPVVAASNEALLNKYSTAEQALQVLAVKGRSPKTGYKRSLFGEGWLKTDTCDTRNQILARDLTQTTRDPSGCLVLTGTLQDPYSGKTIVFTRGQDTSDDVQIDHVVALSDAWQKGAQFFTPALRQQFANDGLNLLAVDGPTNQNKGDGDAATWLPPNKAIRCSYVARQISVKLTYSLWVTKAEKEAMQNILKTCPNQPLAT